MLCTALRLRARALPIGPAGVAFERDADADADATAPKPAPRRSFSPARGRVKPIDDADWHWQSYISPPRWPGRRAHA